MTSRNAQAGPEVTASTAANPDTAIEASRAQTLGRSGQLGDRDMVGTWISQQPGVATEEMNPPGVPQAMSQLDVCIVSFQMAPRRFTLTLTHRVYHHGVLDVDSERANALTGSGTWALVRKPWREPYVALTWDRGVDESLRQHTVVELTGFEDNHRQMFQSNPLGNDFRKQPDIATNFATSGVAAVASATSTSSDNTAQTAHAIASTSSEPSAASSESDSEATSSSSAASSVSRPDSGEAAVDAAPAAAESSCRIV